MSRTRGCAAKLGAAIAIVAGACASDPPAVDWREPIVDSTAVSAGAPDDSAVAILARALADSLDPRACRTSVRVARGRGAAVHAAWWSSRADSSVALMASQSADGGRSWSPPAPVDTGDRGGVGCARPAPSVAAGANGYVHVAYSVEGGDGAGVFFAHSMDGGATFHAPVAIVYGERPSAASVAASGDTVAVAYENPNAPRPRIALALSHTTGHIFEQRLGDVSSANVAATQPEVMVQGRVIRVRWLERATADSSRAVSVVRVGRLR